MKISIIKSPWQNIFIDLLKSANQKILLTSPFIKNQTAKIIVENCSRNIPEFKIINSFKLSYFYKGASDLSALKTLIDIGANIKSVHNLHAKLFIIDNSAIITSANLTPGGLRNNWEYGIKIESEILNEIEKDFSLLFDDQDNPEINKDIINKASDILNCIPVEKRPAISIRDDMLFEDVINDHNIEEKYDGGTDTILNNLTLWKKDVFECLLKIRQDIFTLEEVYEFRKALRSLHPDNRNIEAKIRQQLQYLRNLGLVEFVKPGIYKKLWR